MSTLKATDIDNVVMLYLDKNVRQYLGGPLDEASIRARFPKMLKPNSDTHYWAIRLKENQTFVGIATLGIHHNGRDTEISYQLLPAWWGKGYATEAIQAIIAHALTDLGLPRVIAETQLANKASCRLLERVGMRPEKTLTRFGAKQVIYTT